MGVASGARGRSALASWAAVLLLSANLAKRSRLELSVGGGTRGGASVVVVVGAAVGRVIGGREKGPGGELNDVGFLIFSSLIIFMHKKRVDREELQFYSRFLAQLQSYLIQGNRCWLMLAWCDFKYNFISK